MIVWKILNVDTLADYNGYADVVKSIQFSIEASNGDRTEKYEDKIDIDFDVSAEKPFIPYSELSEEDKLAFLKNTFGKLATALEQIMLKKLG